MADVCFCCGQPATTVVVSVVRLHPTDPTTRQMAPDGVDQVIEFPVCADCSGASWHQVDGLQVMDCPAHGVQHPVEVDDSRVDWYRAIGKNGKRWRQSYPVKTTGGYRINLLDYPDQHGLMMGENQGRLL